MDERQLLHAITSVQRPAGRPIAKRCSQSRFRKTQGRRGIGKGCGHRPRLPLWAAAVLGVREGGWVLKVEAAPTPGLLPELRSARVSLALSCPTRRPRVSPLPSPLPPFPTPPPGSPPSLGPRADPKAAAPRRRDRGRCAGPGCGRRREEEAEEAGAAAGGGAGSRAREGASGETGAEAPARSDERAREEGGSEGASSPRRRLAIRRHPAAPAPDRRPTAIARPGRARGTRPGGPGPGPGRGGGGAKMEAARPGRALSPAAAAGGLAAALPDLCPRARQGSAPAAAASFPPGAGLRGWEAAGPGGGGPGRARHCCGGAARPQSRAGSGGRTPPSGLARHPCAPEAGPGWAAEAGGAPGPQPGLGVPGPASVLPAPPS
ncbi:hypothetical protein H8959_012231 [Pygathrix nigripes]